MEPLKDSLINSDEWIEIVFENVAERYLQDMLLFLIKDRSNIITISHSRLDKFSADSLFVENFHDYFAWIDGISCMIFSKNTSFGALPRNIYIQILKYNSLFDINISFTLKDVPCVNIHGTERQLMCWAIDIAKMFSIKNFFGGLEPASDVATRIFTREIIGPLKLGNHPIFSRSSK